MSDATLAEWLLPLSLATDAGAALPPGTASRTALLGLRVAERWNVNVDRGEVYFGALLRHLGCTSTAASETRIMGDEHELRSSLALSDAASPASMFKAARRGFGAGKPLRERARRVARFLAFAPREVPRIFSDRCDVAVHLAARLGLPPGVQRILDEAYERYDGKGAPAGKKGEELCPAARILAAAELVAMCSQLPGGLSIARDILVHRKGTQFDPDVVSLFTTHWSELLAQFDGDVRAMLLEREPTITVSVHLGDEDAFATAFADFVDLKSPFTVGHSRMVSVLAEDAARELGLPESDRKRLATAGLLHDLGRVSISNAIWDKPGPLTDGERDAMRAHASFTERILQASKPWKNLALLAASDHERVDGSGYPRMSPAPNAGLPARILAAADVLAALVAPRPHRAALGIEDAARVLREEAGRGRLDRAAVDAVLASQGFRSKERPRLPAGMSERELVVLRLLARGLTDKEIASELRISHRTVHHHNQSLFQKIGVSTRGAAALFAVEHGLL
ncbi:MAG TPA: HD domain-containing phosphohydrolase [Polyangiaceae bacterium]|nr:HD domain-containing phosphohydrolase [Polyangiaceae bacterium]